MACAGLAAKTICVFLLAIATVPGASGVMSSRVFAQQIHIDAKDLDEFVDKIIETRKIPGAVVGIVVGDKLAYYKAFGKRESKKKGLFYDMLRANDFHVGRYSYAST